MILSLGSIICQNSSENSGIHFSYFYWLIIKDTNQQPDAVEELGEKFIHGDILKSPSSWALYLVSDLVDLGKLLVWIIYKVL